MDYKKLEEENIFLRAKIESLKTYKKNYFQTVSKGKTRHCYCCNKDIKYNSFSNHEKGKKHIKLIKTDDYFDNLIEDANLMENFFDNILEDVFNELQAKSNYSIGKLNI